MKTTQAINGILLIDKPAGFTSNAILQRVKYLYGARKAGHTGSLDPLATGMLPICFGEATKFSQLLLDAPKCYQVTGLLGYKTATGDTSGAIINERPVAITKAQLESTLTQFTGTIEQIPSMFSALKHQGVPLYTLARKGIEIERKPRQVEIFSLQLLAFNGHYFTLRVHCSKGTYIRNLVEDIGERLETSAHVVQLHRLFSAPFENNPMYAFKTLQSFSDVERMKLVLPVDRAVEQYPVMHLNEEEAAALSQGKIITQDTTYEDGSIIRLYQDTIFLGLGEIIGKKVKVKRFCKINQPSFSE